MPSPLAAARTTYAAALSAVTGYDVRPRPFRAAPKAGDGWVVVSRIAPVDYVSSSVTLTAVIVLGADELAAEDRLEEDGVALVDAASLSDLPAADVALEPATLLVGVNSSPLFGVTLAITVEVSA